MLPTDIQIQKSQKHVRIRWENGEERIYTFFALRSHCPCADCATERERSSGGKGQMQLQIPLRSPDWDDLMRVELVGNYAMCIYWKDGHHQGIYSWETLYEIPSKPVSSEEQ